MRIASKEKYKVEKQPFFSLFFHFLEIAFLYFIGVLHPN